MYALLPVGNSGFYIWSIYMPNSLAAKKLDKSEKKWVFFTFVIEIQKK